MDTLAIGQLAKQAEVNLETIRYYERRGLISEPPRNQSGHRRYPLETLKKIQFIKRSQALGFSLNEILSILELRMTPDSTCADMQSRVSEKIKTVEEKIVELNQIKKALRRMLDKCSGTGPIGHCPILEELYR